VANVIQIKQVTMNEKIKISDILNSFDLGLIDKKQAESKLFDLFNVSNSFYCQREIEMKTICDKQCKHCKEYYEPLENDC